jgi:hypothetical protein
VTGSSRILAATVAASLTGVMDAAVANQSIYTSLRRTDCRRPSPEIAATFELRGLGVQACPAPDGLTFLVVASDTNTWVEIRSSALTWSSEDAIVYDSPLGLFPTAGASPTAEWRKAPDGRFVALIFRVSAQPTSAPKGRISRLFVVRLETNRACLIGRVSTNARARALADGPSDCQ